MAHPDPGAVPRRPQHISSIAHLFLQDDLPGEGNKSLTASCELAVVTPGVTAISAFAAAGLAMGSTRPVVLSEDRELRWSANSFLSTGLAQIRQFPGQDESHRNTWKITTDCVEPDSGPVHWNHLGCLGQADLAHLESLAGVRGLVEKPLAGADGLIWCLLARDAGRFGPSYLLGRMVELVKPARIGVLVFPDAWSEAGRPGWLDDIRQYDFERQDPRILDRCREVVKLVCDDVPLTIHRIDGTDNLKSSFSTDRSADSLWRTVGDLMATGAVEC